MSLNSEVALKCLCLPGAIKQSELWHKATQRLRTERRLWANVKMNPTAKTGVTFFCPPRRQRDINGSIHHHEERGWGPAAGDDGKSSSVKSQVLDLLFSFFLVNTLLIYFAVQPEDHRFVGLIPRHSLWICTCLPVWACMFSMYSGLLTTEWCQCEREQMFVSVKDNVCRVWVILIIY